jgi:hypothetical protein
VLHDVVCEISKVPVEHVTLLRQQMPCGMFPIPQLRVLSAEDFEHLRGMVDHLFQRRQFVVRAPVNVLFVATPLPHDIAITQPLAKVTPHFQVPVGRCEQVMPVVQGTGKTWDGKFNPKKGVVRRPERGEFLCPQPGL